MPSWGVQEDANWRWHHQSLALVSLYTALHLQHGDLRSLHFVDQIVSTWARDFDDPAFKWGEHTTPLRLERLLRALFALFPRLSDAAKVRWVALVEDQAARLLGDVAVSHHNHALDQIYALTLAKRYLPFLDIPEDVLAARCGTTAVLRRRGDGELPGLPVVDSRPHRRMPTPADRRKEYDVTGTVGRIHRLDYPTRRYVAGIRGYRTGETGRACFTRAVRMPVFSRCRLRGSPRCKHLLRPQVRLSLARPSACRRRDIPAARLWRGLVHRSGHVRLCQRPGARLRPQPGGPQHQLSSRSERDSKYYIASVATPTFTLGLKETATGLVCKSFMFDDAVCERRVDFIPDRIVLRDAFDAADSIRARFHVAADKRVRVDPGIITISSATTGDRLLLRHDLPPPDVIEAQRTVAYLQYGPCQAVEFIWPPDTTRATFELLLPRR